MKVLVTLLIVLGVIGGGLYFSKTSRAPDQDQQVMASSVPAYSPTASDMSWEQSQKTSGGTDTTSLEADINATAIIEEDFSDLQ